MKKFTFVVIGIYVALSIVEYLMFSMAWDSFNTSTWSMNGRVTLVIVNAASLVVSFIVTAGIDDIKGL